MTKLYQYFVLAGLAMTVTPALASGVPVYSSGEVTTMAVDQFQSNVVHGLVDVQNELVQSALDAVGGPYSFSVNSFQKGLSQALTPPSKAISAYDGLKTIIGQGSEYGAIQVKKCGGNVDDVIQRLDETIVYPAIESAEEGVRTRMSLTEEERNKINNERAKAMERAATNGLAKAWTVQGEAAKIALAISDTQEELENADSQFAVLATILRLQEETQKNLNTRLSIMSDDLVQTGFVALDSNI